MTDQNQTEMPRYRCHKVVHALKIDGIIEVDFFASPDGQRLLQEQWKQHSFDPSKATAGMTLPAEVDHLRRVLRAAKEKLEIYRKERGGEYTGGMEYATLMRLIDDALERQ